MKAVVYGGPGTVRVDDVPEPKIDAPGDAVVKVSRTAICGSDLHLLHGKTPGMRDGGVIGHEFVGVVTDGPERFVGHRVLGSFLIACGSCDFCSRQKFNFCRNRRALGLGALTGDLDGAQAEYVRVPDAAVNLKPVPDGLDDEQALFAGDILATGFYAARICEIAPDDIVAIFGAGPVGLFTALAARRFSPERILLIDQDPERVRFARDVYDFEALDTSEMAPEAVVAGATDGRMATVAVDAVGAVGVVKSAMKVVRDGSRIAVVGVYGSERYELPMGVAWVRGIDLRFSGMANVQATWDEALDAIASDELDPTRAITHRLSLDDAVAGYELFESRQAMKVVLQP
ncbi:MAG: alcohol dehydrogenase catalytic domain-containing protein [Actinobacteria bacterium]|nr:alcohol dehydrogenase catalytic domain-containing protein [Actinomycetota bacterium]